MNELKQLAQFASSLRLEDLPQEVLQAARFCVLDTMGSALGAVGYDEVPSVAKELVQWNGTGGEYTASLWGQGLRANPFCAMLLNGMLAHALELDDVHTGSKSHVGAVVVPAAWTLAEAIGADGKRFMEAVAVGYEVMTRIGMGMDVASNRKRGWHTTGVIGTFGAAAACARLLNLDAEKTLSALGMAGTQSSGLWAFLAEGSTCKKLHPARAAVNGLAAAILAKGGMTGPEHILDAEDGGLYQAVSDSFDMSKVSAGLGKEWELLHMDKKPYPCCRTTHHAIDGALALREQYHLDIEMIESLLVETYDVGVLQCGFTKYPESPVEAKFSIPFTCAAAIRRGKVTQGEFTEELLADPEVKRVAQATVVKADPLFTERYPKRWGSRVTAKLKDGRTLVQQVDDMSGSVRMPLTQKQEKDKFLGLAAAFCNEQQAQELMEQLLHADTLTKLPDLG